MKKGEQSSPVLLFLLYIPVRESIRCMKETHPHKAIQLQMPSATRMYEADPRKRRCPPPLCPLLLYLRAALYTYSTTALIIVTPINDHT